MSGVVIAQGDRRTLGSTETHPSVLLDLRWQADIECDVSVLVCGPGRRVVNEGHFVFYNQPASPDRSVVLLTGSSTGRSQVAIDMTGLQPIVERMVVSLSTSVDGGTLESVKNLSLVAIDPRSGEDLVRLSAVAPMGAPARVVAEIERSPEGYWRLLAADAEYASGLAELVTEHGINL